MVARKPPVPEGQGYRGEFRQLVREVRELAAPHLDKFAKRDYENAKIRALGGAISKRQKMPLPLLKKFKAKAHSVIAEQEQVAKDTGVQVRMGKHISYQDAEAKHKKDEKRWRDFQRSDPEGAQKAMATRRKALSQRSTKSRGNKKGSVRKGLNKKRSGRK